LHLIAHDCTPPQVPYGLPTSGAELGAAGGPERYILECLLLLRADYPIFAYRRLKALDALCVEAGAATLSSLGDRRVEEHPHGLP
jgi:hypothetical protein